MVLLAHCRGVLQLRHLTPHSVFSFRHFRSYCFLWVIKQRCDAITAWPRRLRHQGQPARKIEIFKMINQTCLRNNGIILDCLLLVGAKVLESPSEALRFSVNLVIQLNKMAFEQTRMKAYIVFSFPPHLNSLRTCIRCLFWKHRGGMHR